MKKRILSPNAVMLVIIAIYVVKVLAKYSVGTYASSSAQIADAWHNTTNIVSAIFVIVAVLISNLKRPEYPYGLHRVESIFSAVTGLLLLGVAVDTAAHGLSALLSVQPAAAAWGQAHLHLPAFAPVKLGLKYLPWILAVSLSGAVCSWYAGNWQMRQGKESGHESIVSDGRETRTDGIVELGTAAGAILENILGLAWIEGIVTLLVAFFIAEAAFEILRRGLRSLVLKSIGIEIEADLKRAADVVPGVIEAIKLRTFFSGPVAIINVKIVSRSPLLAQRDIKQALEQIGAAVLAQRDITSSKFYIRFAVPDENPHRIAIGVMTSADGAKLIAPTPNETGVVYVCDIVDGELRNVVEESYAPLDIASFLEQKRVQKLICSGEIDPSWIQQHNLPVERAPHWSLSAYCL